MSAGTRAGRRPVCGVLHVETCTVAIAVRFPTPRNGGPAGPGMAVSAADTRVSVSGSGWLQSADVTLCLTGSGEVSVLERTKNSRGSVGVSLRRPTDALLKAIAGLWPRLWKLDLAGEQRQHPQAIDIRA